jgi:hypothetical protein
MLRPVHLFVYHGLCKHLTTRQQSRCTHTQLYYGIRDDLSYQYLR